MHRLSAAPLVALVLAASPLAACAPQAHAAPGAAPSEAAIPVRLVAVEAGPVAHPIRASGLVATKDGWDLVPSNVMPT